MTVYILICVNDVVQVTSLKVDEYNSFPITSISLVDSTLKFDVKIQLYYIRECESKESDIVFRVNPFVNTIVTIFVFYSCELTSPNYGSGVFEFSELVIGIRFSNTFRISPSCKTC